MIDTKNTDEAPRRDHSLKSGDTPALGLPFVPGSGGKRRAHTLGIDVEATAKIVVDDDVLWHDREAVVTEVYPAGQAWLRVLCKIEFEDGGPSVVVGRDELELIEDDGARYFVSLAEAVLEDTAPLPSPVLRTSVQVPTVLIEESAAEPTEQLPRVGDVELDDEGQAALADPFEEPSTSGTLPTHDPENPPTLRTRFYRAALAPIVEVWLAWLRLLWQFVSWPFRRDGARDLAGWLVDQVAEGVEAAADWEHWHSRLVAKVVLGALSVAVLGGAGVAWLLMVVAR